jgi:hypothetical protein
MSWNDVTEPIIGEHRILVEIQAVAQIEPIHEAQ